MHQQTTARWSSSLDDLVGTGWVESATRFGLFLLGRIFCRKPPKLAAADVAARALGFLGMFQSPRCPIERGE
jgi:hypothetical protein